MGISNTYFQFKQFRVAQEHCAMKVTTDACIQGAWTPVNGHVNRILDIGTGTGLLALMLAQKNPNVIIDAIEMDKDAATQAKENVESSPWADHINILEGNVVNYPFAYKYDFIISNPPFFNNSLLSDKDARNKARHTASLSYEDLFRSIAINLSDRGVGSVLLPATESKIWEHLVAEKGWHVNNRLLIKHRENADIKRIVTLVSATRALDTHDDCLVIQNSDGSYTADFIKLLAPYYLNL